MEFNVLISLVRSPTFCDVIQRVDDQAPRCFEPVCRSALVAVVLECDTDVSGILSQDGVILRKELSP
jgi:hypothetical protein